MNLEQLFMQIVEEDLELKKQDQVLELRYEFIKELVEYREKFNLTQKDFANEVDLKQQAISRFEKGEIDPRLSFITKILKGMKKEVVIKDVDYSMISLKEKIGKRMSKRSSRNFEKLYAIGA